MDLVKLRTRTEAQSLAVHCLEGGSVVPTRHFREELAADGFDIQDAFHVIRHGCIYREPEQDIKTGQWKYRVEGSTADRRSLAVVFSFKTVDMCFLISVFADPK